MKQFKPGNVWKFGDHISTDLIAPGRLSHLRSNLPELAKHVLEDADLDFPQKVRPSDYIVAGENFGTGSSREHAAEVINLKQVQAVVAKSFARIFFRNASNIGLWLIQADTDLIATGDTLTVDLEHSRIEVAEKELSLPCVVPRGVLFQILEDGGLIQHLKKHGRYIIETK